MLLIALSDLINRQPAISTLVEGLEDFVQILLLLLREQLRCDESICSLLQRGLCLKLAQILQSTDSRRTLDLHLCMLSDPYMG